MRKNLKAVKATGKLFRTKKKPKKQPNKGVNILPLTEGLLQKYKQFLPLNGLPIHLHCSLPFWHAQEGSFILCVHQLAAADGSCEATGFCDPGNGSLMIAMKLG